VVDACLEEGGAPAAAAKGRRDAEETDPARAVGIDEGDDAARGLVGLPFGRDDQPSFFAGGEVVRLAVVGGAVLEGDPRVLVS
jgi:hypothetical protein